MAVVDTLAPASDAAPSRDEMYSGKRTTAHPKLWERQAEEASVRRHERHIVAYRAVCDLHVAGANIADIAHTVGVSRRTIYRYLHLPGPPERKRPGRKRGRRVLEPYEEYLVQRWTEGCHNGVRLWHEIQAMGFTHSVTNVARFTAQLRRDGLPRQPIGKKRSSFASIRGPSAREVALLVVRQPTARSPEQATYLDLLCQRDREIVMAYDLVQDFVGMARDRRGQDLDAWIERATESGIMDLRRFAIGLRADHTAVQAGLTLEHSNGQTEGQINRLKLIKRTMYGRGKFDLLRQRFLRVA